MAYLLHLLVSFFGLLAALSSASVGQDRSQQSLDRFTVHPPRGTSDWKALKPTVESGQIRSFDGQQLIWSDASGKERRIDSLRISNVIPAWATDQAAAAATLVEEGDYRRALEQIPQAVRSGLPTWQQQLLVSYMVRAAWQSGNQRTAGILFLKLAETKPPPLLYGEMPLCWANCEASSILHSAAVEWIQSSDDTAQLLGASWLLSGSSSAATADRLAAGEAADQTQWTPAELSEKAKAAITRLKGSSNSTIAQLAVAQSWRTVPPPQIPSNLLDWFDFRNRLLPPLQLGPTELLAERLMRTGETDLAIGQWLRIAAQHSERYDRATSSLEAAARQLRRLGKDSEAERLDTWIAELRGE